MKVIWFLLVGCCLMLTACVKFDPDTWSKEVTDRVPTDDSTLARHFIQDLQDGNRQDAYQQLSSDLQSNDAAFQMAFDKVHDLLSKSAWQDIRVIGYQVNNFHSSSLSYRQTDIGYQIHLHDSWVLGDVLVYNEDNTKTIKGFHFRPIPNSLDVLNQFTFRNKTAFHYFVFSACLGVPCFILYALILCICTRVRRKWLWIIFILFGLMRINFNWSTGAWSFQPLAFNLLGVGFHASGPYAPWIFDFGFPAGAMMFLIKRRSLAHPPVEAFPSGPPIQPS